MRSAEIVDPSGTKPRQRRRTLLQVGGPILGVVLVVAVILVVALRTYMTNRTGVLNLTRTMFTIQENELSLRVSDYLSPASATATVAHDVLADEHLDGPPPVFVAYAKSMLVHVPQIESFYLADDTGAFWFVGRNPSGKPTGFEWASFRPTTAEGGGVFHHWYYSPDGKLLSEEDTPAGPYDPRHRDWYEGALAAGHLYWGEPVAFRQDQRFVVTAATPMAFSDGRKGAFAINISLNQMAQFLAGLHMGQSGRAVVLDGEGRIVAGAGMVEAANAADWDFSKMRVSAAREPVFTQAMSRYNVYGAGPQRVFAHGRYYVTVAAPLEHARQRGWLVLLGAQESDFAAFTRVAGRQNLLFSLVIVVLAMALAGFLVRQNRKTEMVRRVLLAERAMRRSENGALSDLAAQPGLFDPESEVPLLTERLAETADARRVGLWRLVERGERCLCEDAYDRAEDVHSAGLEFGRGDVPELFEIMEAIEPVEVKDAASDDRLRAFHRLYLRAAGSRGALIVPVHVRGRAVGMVVVEDAQRGASAQVMGAFVSGIAAIRFVAQAERASEAATSAGEEAAAPTDAGENATAPERQFGDTFLLAPGADAASPLPAGRYPFTSAATVVFGLASSPAIGEDTDLLPVVQKVARQIQDIAREHQLFFVQAVANRLLLVGGCGREDDRASTLRLADAVLAIREACLFTLADAELTASFRIGMHVGPALGAELGEDPGAFTLWGEAVQFSELLAESLSETATIQVSENAYLVLRDHFLFRPRGDFYLPRTGATRSFILAGRR